MANDATTDVTEGPGRSLVSPTIINTVASCVQAIDSFVCRFSVVTCSRDLTSHAPGETKPNAHRFDGWQLD